MVCIELDGAYPWPDEGTRKAVTGPRARPKRWSFTRQRPHGTDDIAADLWASDDDQFAAALTTASDTAFALAIATSGHTPYYVNKVDGVRRFELTDDEFTVAVEYISSAGQDPAYLIPFS
ncbi:hypothetical protein [Nostocoides sp. HKS02]|uniref:hypothetical protein n=1 Tax=Nostocoides sp. HKS02 TaxID=1813880 RepID=UPI0012B48C6F|nr:hypothetical protein [Tetrasphaera sp. HKS02]QGN58445.1 hypothetical protein GKE56_11755 [Tetrasphaera sp. HKS02]